MAIRVFNPFTRSGTLERARTKMKREIDRQSAKIEKLEDQIAELQNQLFERTEVRDALQNSHQLLSVTVDAGNVVFLEKQQ